MAAVESVKRVVFWQNQLSHHQSPTMIALANLPGHEVVWVVERDVKSSTRAGQGWPDVESGGVKVVTSPDSRTVQEILADSPQRSVHVFSGIFFVPMVRRAFLTARRRKLSMLLMTESPTPPGLRLASEKLTLGKRMRFMLPWAHRFLRITSGRHIKGVLCIGCDCVEWFQSIGYQPDQLFSWAYLPPPPKATSDEPSSGGVKFVYLGEISQHKGVDLIVDAGIKLMAGCEVVLVGEGPMRADLEERVRRAGASHCVSFVDFLPWQEAMDLLTSGDTTLVPSRYDGWGAVTSESLMRGVPVIVSDGAGSRDLVRCDETGCVVKNGDLDSLVAAMSQRIDKGKLSQGERKRVVEWSSCLTGGAAAGYMAQILTFVEQGGSKPIAPWMG